MFSRALQNIQKRMPISNLCIFNLEDKIQQTNLTKLQALRKMAQRKSRENPVILKLDSVDFHSLFTEDLNTLASIFKEHGHDIRIAGGAVRDLLMGVRPTDLDFATTATPTEMKKMFTSANVRLINLNGEKHGTITPRINTENFEVTTLRIDIVTDGRHAEVQWTTDWMLDALRRDLTINSMFLSLDGNVYDYFYGYDDLKEHRVRFVGDAVVRIQEDFLRILRYFRFYGKISKTANQHDPDTLKAITANREGLSGVSGERIWMELKKILSGNYAGDLLLQIIDCKLGKFIGLKDDLNIEALKTVWMNSHNLNLKLHPISLLSSLLNNLDDALVLHARLKLSAFDRDLCLFIVEHRSAKPNPKPLMPYQQIVLKSKKPSDTFQYVTELLKYKNSAHLENFQQWSIPKFPISGNMLKEKGVESGKLMGLVLNELKCYWADHDFNKTPEELLQEVPHILEVLSQRKRNK